LKRGGAELERTNREKGGREGEEGKEGQFLKKK